MSEFNTQAVLDLLDRVHLERVQQHESWGPQDHPSLYSEDALRRWERQAESWKAINDAREAEGTLSWDGILLEEVYEALSETEPTLRIAELIQVAAVALAEAESIQKYLDEEVTSDTLDAAEIAEAV